MRSLLRTAVFIALAAATLNTWADTVPIRMVLPFGAGSGTDNVARPLLDEVGRTMKQTFIIDNRPGASGFIAAEAVAHAAPDGRTLLMTTNTTHAINPVLFRKLPYDPVKDFRPLVMISTSPYLLLVRKDLPVHSLKDLVNWISTHPAKASYGWGAAVSQMAGASFLKHFNLSAVGVPYKSSPQAVTDLIGGQLSFVFLDMPAALPLLSGDRLKPLLVTSPRRLATLPSVPTATEAGLTDFDVAAWIGIFAPAGTPDARVQGLVAAVTEAMTDPALLKKLENCCVPTVLTGDAFGAFVKNDLGRWSERAAAAGIQPE